MSLSKHLLTKKEDGGKIVFSGSLDLREAVKAIELKINEEETKSMNWILGDLDTFPVQQSDLEDILMSKGKSANQVKKSASAIMQWFKKPLKLEYGRGNFVGWEAKVKKSDLVFSEKLGLLKSIKSDTVSPSMFMLWESQTFRMGKLTAFYKRQKKNHCVTASPQPQSISGC